MYGGFHEERKLCLQDQRLCYCRQSQTGNSRPECTTTHPRADEGVKGLTGRWRACFHECVSPTTVATGDLHRRFGTEYMKSSPNSIFPSLDHKRWSYGHAALLEMLWANCSSARWSGRCGAEILSVGVGQVNLGGKLATPSKYPL